MGYPPRRRIQKDLEFLASARGQKPMQLDANHGELVEHALHLGGHFVRVGPLEGWCWCPRLGKWMPVEIKTGEREGAKHEYTPQQRRFMRWCVERGAPWWVWRTKSDVERNLDAMRQ